MDLNTDLVQRATAWQSAGLWRKLRTLDSAQGVEIIVDGKRLLNFSSNDYLGFSTHPVLLAAAREALEKFGAGSGASRLVCGNLRPLEELDAALAGFKGTEAALSFGSGYATALGVVPAIVEKGGTILADKLCHASLIDAARLSGATLRVFPHNDLNYLENLLRRTSGRRLILTESVFSMDGAQAPLADIVALKEKYGAWLLADEAHATGCFGAQGRGLIQQLGLGGRVELQMGTLSKALGAAGGFVAASRPVIEWLVNRARSLVYSTAPNPAAGAAGRAALALCLGAEGETRRARLRQNLAWLKTECPRLTTRESPILPWMCGANDTAMARSERLAAVGILAPAIRYPTVPKNRARIRFTLSAAHRPEHLEALKNALAAAA